MHSTVTDTTSIDGKHVVVGIFLLAGVMAGGMVIYWHAHIEPFDPLRRAIDGKFPNSYAIVEGGQTRMNTDAPKFLRVTMFVYFSLVDKTKRASHVDAVANLCREHFDFTGYDFLEVHLLGAGKWREGASRPMVSATSTARLPVSRVLSGEKTDVVR